MRYFLLRRRARAELGVQHKRLRPDGHDGVEEDVVVRFPFGHGEEGSAVLVGEGGGDLARGGGLPHCGERGRKKGDRERKGMARGREEARCPVCLEEFGAEDRTERSRRLTFGCAHALCAVCDRGMERRGQHRCPVCRSPRIGMTAEEAAPRDEAPPGWLPASYIFFPRQPALTAAEAREAERTRAEEEERGPGDAPRSTARVAMAARLADEHVPLVAALLDPTAVDLAAFQSLAARPRAAER